MKTIFLMLFCCFHLPLFSQLEFAPVGAKWTYDFFSYGWLGNRHSSLFIIESEKDTLIQNTLCKKLNCYFEDLDSSGIRFRRNIKSQFIYQDQYKIYHYVENQFELILDFNPFIGQEFTFIGWDIHADRYNAGTFEYIVTNVFIDSNFTFLPNHIQTEITCHARRGWIMDLIEKIGFLTDVFFYTNIYCVSDIDLDFVLRCYEDSSTGLIQFDSIACDSIKPDIIRTKTTNEKHVDITIGISSDQLTIYHTDQAITFDEISVFSLSGQCVHFTYRLLKRYNPTIDISHLTPGLYFLRLKSGKSTSVLKFVK
jgi:hypothetical protein